MSKTNHTSKQKKQQNSTKKPRGKTGSREQGFWNESKENVNEGAKIVSKELRTLGKRFVNVTESLLGTVQDKTNEMYQYGLDITNNGEVVHDIADHIKEDINIKKLNAQKKELAENLGMHIYEIVKDNKNKVPENFHSNKELLSVIKKLKAVDKEIKDYQKDIKK